MNIPATVPVFAVLSLLFVGTTFSQTAPITESFKKDDIQRIEALAQNVLSKPTDSDLGTLFYATGTLKVLGVAAKNSKPVCDFVKSKVTEVSGQLQNAYYVAGINKALACGIASKDFEKTLKTVEDDKVKMQDKFFGVQAAADFGALSAIGSQAVMKSLATHASVDTPLPSQVYGVHIASVLAPKTNPTPSAELNNLFSLVEDIVGQADEVNEKYLQLEGGLGVTALFLEGAFNLAAKMNKPPLILQNKLQQLASYVMSRKDSQSLKSVYFVVLAASTLSDNKHFVPVCVSLENFAFSTSKDEKVGVSVSNLLGRELKGVSGVTAEQVERNSDGVIIVNKEQLKSTPAEKTVYTLDLLKLKPGAGFYTLTVSVSASGSSAPGTPKLVGTAPGNAKLSVRVLTEVTASNMNIAVIDAESSSTIGRQTPVTYPNTLKSTLFADSTQKVVASFSIKDKHSNLDFEPHQVFMRLVHKESQQEVFFVCEKQGNQYEFEMKVRASDSILKSLSGDYEMWLIVGDAVVSNS